VENLFISLEVDIKQGRGSRVRFTKGERILNMHKPHKKELPRYVVELIRDFLSPLDIVS